LTNKNPSANRGVGCCYPDGGAGNRTRVRKPATAGNYVRSRCLLLSRRLHRQIRQPSSRKISPIVPQAGRPASLLHGALTRNHRRGFGRACPSDGLSRESKVNVVVGFCVFCPRDLRGPEHPRHASNGFMTLVETSSPPQPGVVRADRPRTNNVGAPIL
jgi:hypothetical protein